MGYGLVSNLRIIWSEGLFGGREGARWQEYTLWCPKHRLCALCLLRKLMSICGLSRKNLVSMSFGLSGYCNVLTASGAPVHVGKDLHSLGSLPRPRKHVKQWPKTFNNSLKRHNCAYIWAPDRIDRPAPKLQHGSNLG